MTSTRCIDLSAGQYRRGGAGKPRTRALKLVHHVVLSMPAPTPPEKVLAAARKFAREQFGAERRYAMVLHTDQRHPHVHLVVQAEGLSGRKHHIDNGLLGQWRASRTTTPCVGRDARQGAGGRARAHSAMTG